MATVSMELSDADVDRIASAIACKLVGASQPAAEPAEKLLWTEEEAAGVLGVAALTLRNWRSRGLIEASTQTRPILYDRPALERIAKFIVETGREGRGRD